MTKSAIRKSFQKDDEGVLSVEAALILPVILWAYIGLFVLFDAFQAKSVNIKAAATIGDLLSREINPVNAEYIAGLNDVLDVLVHSTHPTELRVSVVRYDGVEDTHILVWSHGTGTTLPLTEATMSEIEPHIPAIQDAGTVIVVETRMAYEPFLNIGVRPMVFENVVVTSPRFAPQLKWREA